MIKILLLAVYILSFNHLFSEEPTPLITEEQLINIINNAKNAPIPEEKIEITNDELSEITDKVSKENQPTVLFSDIGEAFKKYNFSKKSDELHVGHLNSDEFTSSEIIDNSEIGVGVGYKEDTSQKKNDKYWDYTPIYATGKYIIDEDSESSKYLKINLGYAFKEYDDKRTNYEDDKVKGNMYYGIGGGIDYNDVSFGLMYQVNKDSIDTHNSSKDDNRVTFSVDYQLNF